MLEYLNKNGKTYTEAEIQAWANQAGVSLQEYIDSKTFEVIEPGKAKDSTVDPTMSQDDMGSELDDGSSESVSWFDQTWFGRGVAAASTTGEATDLMAQDFSNIDMESIQEFMKAKEQEAKSHVPSERMEKFQKQYQEEGSTWSAFFRGVKDQPGLLPELFVQSLGTQVGTLIDSPGASLAAAGAGAAGGAAVAAVPGAVAGFMGGLATSMEAALTFGELLETELKEEGKEFTDENIKALLEGPKGNSIRNRAIGRGLTIGAVEGLSGGVAGKAAVATRKAVATVKGAKTTAIATGAAGVAVEGVGGGVGEVLGRVAADQEMDAAEIGFEAITGTTTAPINILTALKSAKQPTYSLNGVDVTYKEMKDFVETADDIDVAKAKIKIEDDFTGVGTLAAKKQNKAIVDSQIDDKITDKKDRDTLIELNDKRIEAEANVKKKGIDKVPNAPEELATIQAEIDAIIGKYEGAMGIGETQKAQDVAKVVRENRISDTIAFAETQGQRIGKQTIVVDNNEQAQAAHDKIAKEMGLKAQDVTDADGFIVGDSIIINKDVAGRTGAINVGAHEVLHGVLAKHMQSLDNTGKKKLISSFKKVLSKNQLAAVTKRLEDNYSDVKGFDIETTEEWFTAFSDAIEQNEIAFDEGVFGKIKNTIQEILRKFGIKKDFADGRQAYNFLKDYSKSIKNNKLSSRAMALAGEGATVTDAKMSVSPLEAINDLIPKNIKTKKEFNAFVQDRRLFPPVFMATMDDGVISNYVKSRSIGDEYRGAIESVQNRITNFDPEATRADGSIVGPEGFGEFIFANTRFGKLDSKKALAIKAEKQKQEVRGDQVTETGKTVFEGLVSEEPSKKKKAEPKGQKRRVLKSLADVTLENKEIISTTARAEINALIEQNPKNLEEQLTSLIEKEITKAVKKQMGKISKVQGEVVINDEYKAFIALNYENIVQGLDVSTIKNNYKTLFELTEIGKEDRRTLKSDKPSLKKDSNYRKSIFKIETNKAKFTKFFTEGGYTTLLARQKGLANQIAKGITEDVINNEIIDNSKDLNAVMEAEFRNFAKSLNKQKAETVGNYADQIKFSKTALKDANFLRNEIKTQGINKVFKDGKLLPKYNKLNKKAADFIYSLYKGGLIEDINDITYIQQAFKKLFKAGKRGEAYEYSIIDQAITLEKMLGKDVVNVILRKPTEVGGKPDAIIKIYDTVFNIEAKMTNAQYSSVTFAVDDNKFLIKKDYTFNDQILPLGKQVQRGIRAAKARLKKEGYDWSDISIMPTDLYNILKSEPVTIDGVEYSSYINAMSAEMDISLDVVSEIYNKKKGYPVNVIQLMGRGLFYMGGFNNVANILNLPLFKGNAKLTLRVGSNSQKRAATQADVDSGMVESIYTDGTNTKKKGEKKSKRQVKTGNKSLSFRAIPTLSPDVLNSLKSDKSVGTMAGLKSIVDSKEGQALKMSKSSKSAQTLNKAVQFSRSANNPTKGITVLDFDDTLATSKSLVISTSPDGVVRKLTAEEFATEGADLLDQGWTHDFSEFSKVVDGKVASLFKKAMKLQGKFGPENMFVLTARPADSAPAIFEFLKANGLNIPLKNITGLANSTSEAKALWIADKVGEGFNDFYFADDALQNVQAVKNMLDQFDVKSKVQQAKANFFHGSTKFSKSGVLNAEQRKARVEKYAIELSTPTYSDYVEMGKQPSPYGKRGGRDIRGYRTASSIANETRKEYDARLKTWRQNKDAIVKRRKQKGLDLLESYKEGSPETKKRIEIEAGLYYQIHESGKDIKFSKSMNDKFNDILENVTGIESDKRFSIIKGRKRGEGKGKFRVFIPPSHEDFVGLLYNFLGKGKEGNAHRDFFEQALIRPLNRANREFDTARQSVANDYKGLNKQFEDVRKKLTKKTADGDFTFQDAIRVYLWDKHGHKIPGLSETDQAKLAELVMSDPQLQAYAETLNVISKQETYVNPTDGWNGGDIRMDLDDATGRIGRKQFFSEFIENADVIFSEENLNKIEAGYGKGVRESLEDMLYRIQTGRNRPSGQNAQVNKLMNYLNGSVGTVMFFNMRSALLQQMSIVNYINFADNNIFAAAKAFANQKQYWADFAFIFNSDMLKQRRGGIQTDINGAELAASLRNSKDITRKLISKLLELGFLPTQIGDNIAIATGGAAYYRNRINKYVKQGMSQKEAEAAAFTDFQDITQSTQQSARPDMVSKQQASVIGKVILNFQNVTSQFNRLGKKAFQDIYNRRITKPNSTQMQSDISNAARITYYFAIQNAIFYTLQTALFAMMFDDDEEDVNNLFIKKQERLINGSIDSVLRGTGLIGGVVATLKNVAIAFARQRDVKYNPDESAVGLEALNLSPVLGIKLRKIVNAEKTLNYNKKVIKEMETFDIDNPQWSAVTNYTEAFTNIPLNRLYNKTQNVRQSLNNDHAAWERTLMFLGWSQYNLNLENKKMEEIKEKTKSKKKKETNTRSKTRTRTRSRTRTR